VLKNLAGEGVGSDGDARMKLTFLGTRGYIEARTRRHRFVRFGLFHHFIIPVFS
jgi:hypothetical protein